MTLHAVLELQSLNHRLSISPSMAPTGSTLLQASCLVLLASAAVSGRRQLLSTDHTYVNNQSSRPIRGTTFYYNGNSQFVNRLIEPGAQGKVLTAPLLLATALLPTTSSPWHVLAQPLLACALWACSVAHVLLKHVQAASISLLAVCCSFKCRSGAADGDEYSSGWGSIKLTLAIDGAPREYAARAWACASDCAASAPQNESPLMPCGQHLTGRPYSATCVHD